MDKCPVCGLYEYCKCDKKKLKDRIRKLEGYIKEYQRKLKEINSKDDLSKTIEHFRKD